MHGHYNDFWASPLNGSEAIEACPRPDGFCGSVRTIRGELSTQLWRSETPPVTLLCWIKLGGGHFVDEENLRRHVLQEDQC